MNRLIIITGDYGINRAEALAVLSELAQIHQEIAFAGIVGISELGDSEEFELRIKCVLDAHGRKSIHEFLQKRNLTMRENEGFIIIC